MGLLDDLKMGFGLAERTEDYDARTARTIAANKAAERGSGSNPAMRLAQARNPQHSTYYGNNPAAMQAHDTFLDSIEEGYRPEVAEDNRPMFQRMLTSPASDPSPRPYAIGPLTMDGPIELPQFGLLGLFAGGLKNMFQSGDEMAPPSTTVRPRLRPEPLGFPTNNGQPETGEEDFSRVDLYNPATDYMEQDFSSVIPSTTAAQDFATNKDFLSTVQSAIDMANDTGEAPLSNSNVYDPTGAFGMRTGTSSIIRLPNGKFVDTLTGRYL